MSSRDGIGRLGVICHVRTRRGPSMASRGSDRTTATHLSCLRIWPAALACARTSFRKEFTSSTINFFMPSIESSSSNEKSNFWFTSDPMEVGRDKKIRHAQARNKERTASQMGSSAGSCHTWRYGWFNACSQLIRLAGSKHNIWERRSIARGLAWGYRVANGTRGLMGSDRM